MICSSAPFKCLTNCLSYTVSYQQSVCLYREALFYARVIFLKNAIQIKHKIPI